MTTLEKIRAEIEQSIPWNTEEKAMKSAVLDVIDKYAEQEPTDVISRQHIIEQYKSCADMLSDEELEGANLVMEWIYKAPPVNPQEQEQKTGHWVEENINEWSRKIYCSECGCPPPFEHVSNGDVYSASGYGVTNKTKHCPGCGARMIESEEQIYGRRRVNN